MASISMQSNDLLIALAMSIVLAIIGFPTIVFAIILFKNKRKQNENKQQD